MRKIIIIVLAISVSVLTANFTALALQPSRKATNCSKPTDGAGKLAATGVTCTTADAVVRDAMYAWHRHATRHAFDVTTSGKLWHIKIHKHSAALLEGVATANHGHRVLFYIA